MTAQEDFIQAQEKKLHRAQKAKAERAGDQDERDTASNHEITGVFLRAFSLEVDR